MACRLAYNLHLNPVRPGVVSRALEEPLAIQAGSLFTVAHSEVDFLEDIRRDHVAQAAAGVGAPVGSGFPLRALGPSIFHFHFLARVRNYYEERNVAELA